MNMLAKHILLGKFYAFDFFFNFQSICYMAITLYIMYIQSSTPRAFNVSTLYQ